MNKPLHNFFTTDHQRLDILLNKAMENPQAIDMDYYHQFRTGLLRHIKMEEKTLFPAAKKANLEVMQQLIPRSWSINRINGSTSYSVTHKSNQAPFGNPRFGRRRTGWIV